MSRRAPTLTKLLATLLCLAPGLRAQQGSVATDKAALEALYTATDGANWTDNTNWSSAEPLSAWHGVTVDGSGRVTKLELENRPDPKSTRSSLCRSPFPARVKRRL